MRSLVAPGWGLSLARYLALPLLALAAATQGPAGSTPAQDGDAERRAAALRAMVVLKIAPYLTTHRSGGKEYRIAVVGSDLVTAAIQKHLPDKKVESSAIKVVELSLAHARSGDHAGEYDLVFVAASVDANALPEIVRGHADKPVPIVCERPGFAALGGGVQLFVQDNNVRFDVNVDALRVQGVKVAAQLQKLSRKGPP